MKRKLIILITGLLLTYACMAQLNTLVVLGESTDIYKYQYAYVMPTSSVTTGGLYYDAFLGIIGEPQVSINPSDKISGYLMKWGYTILPTISSEYADKTMVVSYGYTGRTVMIQMRDAQTQELVISIETEVNDKTEAEAISNAIYKDMQMFAFSKNPKIGVDVLKNNSLTVWIELSNQTPKMVQNIGLKVRYYQEGEIVHEQDITFKKNMSPGDIHIVSFKKSKGFKSRELELKCEITSYN